MAEIAGERGEPGTAEQAAGIAHGILAVNAGPVGERRSDEQERAGKIWFDRSRHHDLPARLAVADEAGLTLRFRMPLDHLADESGFGAADVLDRLARHRLGREAYEIARMQIGRAHV